MSQQRSVVPPEHSSVSKFVPERAVVLKLLNRATDGNIMVFEETVPAGTKSTLHLHHGGNEVAYVLSGKVIFLIGDEISIGGPGTCAFMPRGAPHAWKSTGAQAGRVLFLYRPGKAGRFIEEQQKTGRKLTSMTEGARPEICGATAGRFSDHHLCELWRALCQRL